MIVESTNPFKREVQRLNRDIEAVAAGLVRDGWDPVSAMAEARRIISEERFKEASNRRNKGKDSSC